MVVWQGITEGGTAVPVQITEEGKVVAIGEAGPEGPVGPEGPRGPAGQVEWPPNPVEGAFLVWLNGEPTWYAEQPIPTPPGLAGPITLVSDNSLLTFENDIDQDVFFQNVNVYAAKADGSNWDGGVWNTSQTWSLDTTTGATWYQTNTPAMAFNGNRSEIIGDYCSTVVAANNYIKIEFLPGVTGTITCRAASTAGVFISVNGVEIESDQGASNTFATHTWNPQTDNISYLLMKESLSIGPSLAWVEINGKLLLEPGMGAYPRGQISVATNNAVVLTRVAGKWAIGDYMKANESAQAAWLFQKNKKALKG